MDIIIAFAAGGFLGFAITVLWALCAVQSEPKSIEKDERKGEKR